MCFPNIQLPAGSDQQRRFLVCRRITIMRIRATLACFSVLEKEGVTFYPGRNYNIIELFQQLQFISSRTTSPSQGLRSTQRQFKSSIFVRNAFLQLHYTTSLRVAVCVRDVIQVRLRNPRAIVPVLPCLRCGILAPRCPGVGPLLFSESVRTVQSIQSLTNHTCYSAMVA